MFIYYSHSEKSSFTMLLDDGLHQDSPFRMPGLFKCAGEEHFHHGSYNLCSSLDHDWKFSAFHLKHLLWECVQLVCAVGFLEAREENKSMGGVQTKPPSCLPRERLVASPWAGSLLICAFTVLPHNPTLVIERSLLSPIKLYYRNVEQRSGSPHFWVCSCPIKHSQLCQLLLISVAK